MSRPLARLLAYWRTGLSGPVIVLQAGTAVNYLGTGLILPFEIIYLHELRGFPTATAGLVLAAAMGTAAVITLPAGALLDRFRAKPMVTPEQRAASIALRRVAGNFGMGAGARYMSLYGLGFTAGVALGPAVGGTLLATSPDAVWWGGALTLALTAAGFLRLGHRIPDPLLPTKSQPLQAAPEPT